MKTFVALFACWMLLFETSAQAHTASSSFMGVQQRDANQFALAIDVAVRDLDMLLGLDGNADGRIIWGELRAAEQRMAAAVQARLSVQRGTAACVLQNALSQALTNHGDGPYVRVYLTARCAADGAFTIGNDGWYVFDPQHRTLLEYTGSSGESQQALLTADAPSWQADAPLWQRLVEFFKQGIVHLMTGYDHLAFLLVLLIGLARTAGQETHWRDLVKPTALIVTAFTVAHSITLLLAATDHVRLPSAPVELAIALSVLITALLTLSRRVTRHGWRHGWYLAFVFGLVHGLGFAGALAELLGTRIEVGLLAAFNLGIEVSQLAVASLCLPLLWWLTRNATTRLALPLLSIAIAGVATHWVSVRWI